MEHVQQLGCFRLTHFFINILYPHVCGGCASQNSTLAGGVAIGAVCNMLNNPWGAMLTGCFAGTIST